MKLNIILFSLAGALASALPPLSSENLTSGSIAAPPAKPTSAPDVPIVHNNALGDKFEEDFWKHNKKPVKLNITLYNEVMQLTREINKDTLTNGSSLSARATSSSNLMIGCVGYAQNPFRMKIFPGLVNCEYRGWTHFYTFMNLKSYAYRVADRAFCIADGDGPSRGMIMPDAGSCTLQGWRTLEVIYGQTCAVGCRIANRMYVHKSNDLSVMALNPHPDPPQGFHRLAMISHLSVLGTPRSESLNKLKKRMDGNRNHFLYTVIRLSNQAGQARAALGILGAAIANVITYGPESNSFSQPIRQLLDDGVWSDLHTSIRSVGEVVRIELSAMMSNSDGRARYLTMLYHNEIVARVVIVYDTANMVPAFEALTQSLMEGRWRTLYAHAVNNVNWLLNAGIDNVYDFEM